ncbi:hypothetical protein [Bowmanella yangjiangensis]|uniref:Uncharacterized protein n=1 Tax=Bowmanella yangjiangensis TaxID=2811230 RepID=A0ABS3CYL3_9ALTE|nr:hypothetical protein [Bowmanella yangjiangensis]MBN7822217.1 hypothetical protein [Bowmanella yangjiangensis]
MTAKRYTLTPNLTAEAIAFLPDCVVSAKDYDDLAAINNVLFEALDGLMMEESRGRIMPIGKAWDDARAAIAKAVNPK